MDIEERGDKLTSAKVREVLGNMPNHGLLGRSRVAYPSVLCPLSNLTLKEWQRISKKSRGGRLATALQDLLIEKIHGQMLPEKAAYYGLLWMRYVKPRSREVLRAILKKGAEATEKVLPKQGREKAPAPVVNYMVKRFGTLGDTVFSEELSDAVDRLASILTDMEQEYLRQHPEAENLPLKRAFVPPLLKKHVTRHLLEKVVEVATARRDDGRPRWQGVILYGMAGVGKTELAKALAYQEEIEDSFEGGIIWINASQDEAEEWAERLCGALGAQREKKEDWLSCWHRAAAKKRLLLIVDDVTKAKELGKLLACLGPQVIVVVTTQNKRQAWTEMKRCMSIGEVQGIAVRGMGPEEGRQLIEAVLERELGEEEWAVVQQIGGVVGWHAEELFTATLESCESDWDTVQKLAESGLLSEQWFDHQWSRMNDKERDRVESLVRWMKRNGPFGSLYGTVVWDTSLQKAERQLRRFEGMGFIQEMEAQRGALRSAGPLWQVTWMVYRALRPKKPKGDWEEFKETARRYRVARGLKSMGEPLYRAPIKFRLVQTIHWLAVIVKIVVAIPLKVTGWVTGRWSLYNRWMDWTILLRVEAHLKARWLEAGIEPTQEFWLVYDSRNVVTVSLLFFELVGLVVWEILYLVVLKGVISRWEHWIALGWMVAWFLLIVWQVTWRVWIAHLYGVKTWDLQLVLRIARLLGMKEE